MNRKPHTSSAAAKLRRHAEARLQGQRPEAVSPRAEADTQRLIHELQVHQIELEMQNEELQKARDVIQAGMEKYTNLYDFAPVGYLTLDPEGTIQEANLSGAGLLGIERSRLIKRRFGHFVSKPSLPAFAAFLAPVFASKARQCCEVTLLKQGKIPVEVRIEAVATTGQECHAVLEDIAARKQAEAERARLERLFHAAADRQQQSIGVCLREDLCQRLAGIGAFATTLAQDLKAKAPPESDLAETVADEVREALHQALELANLLQPVSALERGLEAALRHLAFQVQEASGIHCAFKAQDLPQLPAADATHLYRIAQEALSNAVWHAKASQIALRVARSDRGLTLTIADDGSAKAESSEPGSVLGLQLLRYRSDLLGAALTIESKPGGGTVVTCCYPLPAKRMKKPPCLITDA